MSSYIVVYQALFKHPKLAQLMAITGRDRYSLVGHLVALWCWALDLADSLGRLPRGTTDAVIADAAGWAIDDAAAFMKALRKVGLFEKTGYQLHDWKDYTGQYHEARRAAALRGAYGNHRRWHLDRNLSDPECTYCQRESLSDSPPESLSDSPSDIASESHPPSSSSDRSIGLIDPQTQDGRKPARENPLNFTDDEWQKLLVEYPTLNLQARWLEWVSWIEEDEERRRPKNKMRAFKGFLEAGIKAGAA